MDSARWQRVRALAEEAWEMPDAGERDAFLDRECDDQDFDDQGLKREVEALLAADDDSEDFFTKLAERSGLARDDGSAPDLSGRTVGSYRLLEPLGRGGMGVVYLAERADGEFEQRVAVKLLAMGVSTPDARQRFLVERQILAGLEHPSIAQLFDGGVAEDGTPYFVLEHVEGERIDRWCDRQNLSIDERLRLMIQVCEAVEAAHRQLIVHRDLKPSNVLVTDDGRPKLLDFGVAKVLSDSQSRHTVSGVTGSQGAPLTPAWAAPEQLSGAAVTTATDTHALGALLYLLLTGVPPHNIEDTSPTALAARLETEPVTPSRRLASLSIDEQTDIAADRNTTPGNLTRALQGDLDAVVSRALAPDSGRRYGSAGDLADDLRAHLASHPVSARPPSRAYRVSRFVTRHRLGVTAATTVTVTLLAGFGAALWQARVAAAERDVAQSERIKAQRVTDFTLGLFDAANPESGETLTARELLDEGFERIDEMEQDPLARADMLAVIGAAYARLQQYNEGEEAARRELALRLQHQDPSAPEVAIAYSSLGQMLSHRGEIERAEELLLKAVELDETHFAGIDREDSIWNIVNLVRHYERQNQLEQAEKWGERGLAMARRLWGNDHLQVATLLASQGLLAARRLDYAGAEALYRESLEIKIAHIGEEHPDVASSLHNLGFIAMNAGNLADGESYLRRALELKSRLYGEDNSSTGATLGVLGRLLLQTGRLDQAEEALLKSIEIRSEPYGRRHPQVLPPLQFLADLELERRAFAAAESFLNEALTIAHETLGEHSFHHTQIWRRFAELRQVQDRPQDAVVAYRNELASLEATGDPDRRWIEPLSALARLLAESDPAEARESLEQAEALARQHLEADDPVRQEIEADLAAWR